MVEIGVLNREQTSPSGQCLRVAYASSMLTPQQRALAKSLPSKKMSP